MSRSRTARFTYTAVRSEGGLLPHEFLESIGALAPGLDLTPTAYFLAEHEPLAEAQSRAWLRLVGLWRAFQAARQALPEGDPAVRLTRDRWLLPLFSELGYGRLKAASGPIDADGRAFPISHLHGPVPLHLMGAGVDLDRPTPSVAGAARTSPHGLLQDLLNRSEPHLWGIVTNGRTLRILRDFRALTRQAYIEFDLESIFEGERFADFRLLWLLAHASRLSPAEATPQDPHSAPIERWFQRSRDEGLRALDHLRDGVKAAIEHLGSGFLRGAAKNLALHTDLQTGALSTQDYYRQILRLVYQLIFLFVAEDRDVLLPHLPHDAPAEALAAQARYRKYYATTRLRELALRRRGGPHGDLWHALRLILSKLYGGCPELGLPPLGSALFSPEFTPHLIAQGTHLASSDLLAALLALCTFQEGNTRRLVAWRSIGADELGSVYESLLELHPNIHRESATFTLATAAGNDRKTSGSYYTPSALVEALLDSALDPVLDRACSDEKDPEAALLALRVCDPACGSGHFLVAAGRRLAHRLARIRAGDAEPTPPDLRHALRDVFKNCLFGVDLNPMAVELCKVSLWMEAIEPGRPLPFLDAHILRGNALVGATPALMRAGIPDEAFKELEGDDKEVARRIRKRNAVGDQAGLFESAPADDVATLSWTPRLARLAATYEADPDQNLADVEARARHYREYIESQEYRDASLVADTWCAAFFWPKDAHHESAAPTHVLFRTITRDPAKLPPATHATVRALAAEHAFFHWHLAFPQVFRVGTGVTPTERGRCGWDGGFDVILGNPPWDTLSPDAKEFFSTYDPQIRAQDRHGQQRIIDALLHDEIIARSWADHRRVLYAFVHFLKNSGRFRLYAEGNLGKGDFNVYRMFVELALEFTSPGGYAAQIVPEGLYNGANCMAIRRELFESHHLHRLLGFENTKGVWFRDIDTRTKFALYSAHASGHTDRFAAAFNLRTPAALRAALSGAALQIPVAMVREFSEDALAVMEFHSQRDIDIAARMYARWPRFGEAVPGLSHRHYMREIDMGNDRDLFSEDPTGLPLYEGRMIAHYDHRAKGYRSGRGRSAEWRDYDFGSPEKSINPQWYVPRIRVPDKLGNRTSLFRIGFCDVASPTNERSLVAAFVPPGCVCGDKVPTITFGTDGEPSGGNPDHTRAALTWIAVANSFSMDFIVRKKISLKMSYTVVDSLPFARLAPESPFLRRLAPLVLGLTCTGPEMNPLWDGVAALGLIPPRTGSTGIYGRQERLRALAEIEAIVAYHLYGLDLADLDFILDTFPTVRKYEEKEFGEFLSRRLILEAVANEQRNGPPALPGLPAAAAGPALTTPARAPAFASEPHAEASAPDPQGLVTTPKHPSQAGHNPRRSPAPAVTTGPTSPQSTSPPTDPPPRVPASGNRTRRDRTAPEEDLSTFRLTPQIPAQPRLIAPRPPPSDPAPASPVEPNTPAPRTSSTPPPAPAPLSPLSPLTPLPDDPPVVRHLLAARDPDTTPHLIAILRALHRAPAPLTKSELLAATALPPDHWTPTINTLLQAGLITKQGQARGTRYTLA